MSVREMLKCIAVVSANDCAVAMAEHIAGSESAFVAKMNERARELGMRTMREDGVRNILDGYTTVDEILRYT